MPANSRWDLIRRLRVNQPDDRQSGKNCHRECRASSRFSLYYLNHSHKDCMRSMQHSDKNIVVVRSFNSVSIKYVIETGVFNPYPANVENRVSS